MRGILRAAALTLVGASIGCTATGTTAPDPAVVLRQTGQAMAGVHTISADIKFGSGIAFQGLTVTAASSKVQLPDRSDTVFKAKQGDFLVDIEVVTVAGQTYLRLPLSKFTALPPDVAAQIPDPAHLLDPRTGLPGLLPNGTGNRHLGREKVGDVDCDKVAATYTREQVGRLLGGGIQPNGDVQSTIWAGSSDHYLRRVLLTTQLGSDSRSTQITVDLRDFNRPVTIITPSP